MQFTPTNLRKIGIVYGLLIVLLVIALFVRFWRGNSLNNSITQNNNGRVVSSNPVLYSGSYSLSADVTVYKAGDKVNVTVYFEAPGKQLDGADVVLHFDSSVIGATVISPGTYFRLMPRKEIDDKNGTLYITALDTGTNGPLTGKTSLAVISFTARKAGTTQINFDFTEGGTAKTTLIEHGTSKNILGEAKGITIKIGP